MDKDEKVWSAAKALNISILLNHFLSESETLIKSKVNSNKLILVILFYRYTFPKPCKFAERK